AGGSPGVNPAAAESGGGSNASGGGGYTVQPGDTLSGIAARFDVAGGWHALWQQNRDVVGGNPDALQVGTHLDVH
ncbi:MAG: LysM peptidoglycan-binding domain-containing protein, partial [Nocardioidaceae bacterium]